MSVPTLTEIPGVREGFELEPGKTYVMFLDMYQVNWDVIRQMQALPGINILFVPAKRLPGDPEAAVAKLFEAIQGGLVKMKDPAKE